MANPNHPAPPREQFQTALLSPLKRNDEQMMEARRRVGEWIDAAGATDGEIEALAARFGRADARKGKIFRRFVRPALAIAAILSLSVSLVHPTVEMVRYKADDSGSVFRDHWFQCRDFFPSSSMTDSKQYDAALTRGLTRQQALTLRGDPEIRSVSTRAERLWREHFPDDPAFHYDFLGYHYQEFGKLPDDVLETAERLDPENGFAALAMANTTLADTFKRVSPSRRSRRKPPTGKSTGPEWKLMDKERLARGLALLHKAASKSICTRRMDGLYRKRTAAFRPTGDASTRQARVFRNQEKPYGFGWMTDLPRTLRYNADRLARSGDREALARIIDDWLKVAEMLASNRDEPSDAVTAYLLLSCRKSLLEACRTLNMDGRARKIESISNRIHEQQEEFEKSAAIKNNEEHMKHAGLAANRWLYGASGMAQIEIDPADLAPGRMADYANFDWLALRPAGLALLLLAGLSALFWRIASPPSWALGKRLAQSLSTPDWAWILCLGILAPLAWHGITTLAPAFRTREFDLVASELLQPSLQAGATLILILCSLVQSARWRMARRLAALGRKTRFLHAGWLPPLLAALALPATAFPSFIGIDWTPAIATSPVFDEWPRMIWPFMPSIILLALPLLWLFGIVLLAFAGQASRTPLRAATAFVFSTACVPAVLVLALVASPLLKHEFARRIAADPILDIRPEWNGMSKYEFLYTKGIQKRLIRALKEN